MILADQEDVVARVEEITGGRLADVVIDVTSTATQPILDATEIVRHGGTIVLAGVKDGPTAAIDNDRIVFESITIRGIFTVSSAAYRQGIMLPAKGSLPFGRIHTAAYGFDRAEEAIHHLAGRLDGPPAINVAIAPGRRRRGSEPSAPGHGRRATPSVQDRRAPPPVRRSSPRA